MSELIGDLEALLIEIHRRAEQWALSSETEAQERAKEILVQAEAQAKEAREDILRQTQTDIEVVERRILAQGRLEAQHHYLQAREHLLEQVWPEAEFRLRQLVDKATYPEVLGRLALVAAQELEAQRLSIAADPKGHELLTSERLVNWGEKADVVFERAAEANKTWGGLLIWSGRTRYDATFSTKLALAKEVLREEVYRLLTEVGT